MLIVSVFEIYLVGSNCWQEMRLICRIVSLIAHKKKDLIQKCNFYVTIYVTGIRSWNADSAFNLWFPLIVGIPQKFTFTMPKFYYLLVNFTNFCGIQ